METQINIINNLYLNLQNQINNKSLVKKYLTKELLNKLKYKRTKNNATLYDIICSGCICDNSFIGIYASDTESYYIFYELFEPIIKEYHKLKIIQQPKIYFNTEIDFSNLNIESKYIESTRIRTCFTIKGYPFNPKMKYEDYINIENSIKKVINSIDEIDLKGQYFSLI